ncbi:MAG: hypothetical protein KIG47_00315, partial [Prevotellamassilia sp.]|nr:hypothetical protein [Prevotellamassilia sp.]
LISAAIGTSYEQSNGCGMASEKTSTPSLVGSSITHVVAYDSGLRLTLCLYPLLPLAWPRQGPSALVHARLAISRQTNIPP